MSNVRSLAEASFGVFKPLPANAPEAKLLALLKEERALRQAAVKALSQDGDEHQKAIDRVAELEAALAKADGERVKAVDALTTAQGSHAELTKRLAQETERGRKFESERHEEARLRAQAESFNAATATSLDEANRQLGIVRGQLMQSEERATAFAREIRRPVTAPTGPLPNYRMKLNRMGPGGDLNEVLLVPEFPKEG